MKSLATFLILISGFLTPIFSRNGQVSAPPPPPILAQPSQGATNVSITKQLLWSPEAAADSNRYQIATDSLFAKVVIDGKVKAGTGEYPTIGPLQYSTTYYWHVNAIAYISGEQGAYSATWHFTTVASTAINPPGYSFKRISTTNSDVLKFVLPQKSLVELRIFDSKGSEVKILMNEVHEKGTYSVHLPKKFLNPSYFLKFNAGGFHKVLKL